MNKLVELDGIKYDEYVKNHSLKSHFLQSYYWGEFARLEKNVTPYYMGLVDNKDNILAGTLLLQKHLPLGYSYFYAPRGFVIDFSNYELVTEFTKKIIDFIKTKKAIFLKIDPDIIWHEEDSNNEEIKQEYDREKIFNNLKKIGFKHLGFTKNFETMQPRYTFRIDFNKSWEEIENNFSKTTKQRIKKANDYEVEVSIGTKDDIDTFFQLMLLTENRKDFVTHNKKYYETLYEIWHNLDLCNLFIGKINIDKILNKNKEELSKLESELKPLDKEELSKSAKSKKKELEKRIEKISSDIEKYQNAKEKYGNIIPLSAHFIIEYGNKAWVLYAGNHNILSETYTNYKTYYEHINYYYKKGIKIYDQFGTIGDLRDTNHLLGLHEFKKKFGGNYIEFMGEFDYVTNKFMYFVFTKLVPIYRNIVKKIAKMRK